MSILPQGHEYPAQSIGVFAFPAVASDFPSLFPVPPGLVESQWPPTQLTYLGVYLGALGCRTIVHETHYVDKDYIEDAALFYSRSLRSYPNYCQRLHFFSAEITEAQFRASVIATEGTREEVQARLQAAYLGFTVVRPLPSAPVGRTVLKTFGPTTVAGEARRFGAIRRYSVHFAGFVLHVDGLAFQQQDRGVSACATTALWCAIQKVAPMEGLSLVSPATITEAASRYLLAGGRSLPSEGLTVHQISEASRAAGLAPVLVRSVSPEHDRAQLLAYLSSGFAPVLALQELKAGGALGEGHAVCAVGLKIGNVRPQANPVLSYLDAGSAVEGVYLHDDRLGPYSSAQIFAYTLQVGAGTRLVTGLEIRWPDKVTYETSMLTAIVVPVPNKLRLTVTRMRALGLQLADSVGQLLPSFSRVVTLGCRYELGTRYRERAGTFGLSNDALYRLSCETVLSRYVGLIELHAADGPILDVVLDATESGANPAVLACVQRRSLPAAETALLAALFKTALDRDYLR